MRNIRNNPLEFQKYLFLQQKLFTIWFSSIHFSYCFGALLINFMCLAMSMNDDAKFSIAFSTPFKKKPTTHANSYSIFIFTKWSCCFCLNFIIIKKQIKNFLLLAIIGTFFVCNKYFELFAHSMQSLYLNSIDLFIFWNCLIQSKNKYLCLCINVILFIDI